MAHRYWRVNVTASQAGGNIAIGELEFRATIGGAAQNGGSVIKSIEQPGFSATNAYDASVATAWASNNTIPAWIGRDYGGSPVNVLEVMIQAWSDTTYWSLAPRDFTVDYSDDAVTWTTVLDDRGVPWSGPSVSKTFAIGAGLEATKAVSYSAVGTLPNVESATKALSYGVSGPGIPGTLHSTKAITYGVLAGGFSRQRIKVRLVQRTGAIS